MVVNNINDIIKLLKIYMVNTNTTQKDIWTKLNLKQSAVSRAFNGQTNIKLQTLLDYVSAIDGQIEINIVPKEKESNIIDNTSKEDQ